MIIKEGKITKDDIQLSFAKAVADIKQGIFQLAVNYILIAPRSL